MGENTKDNQDQSGSSLTRVPRLTQYVLVVTLLFIGALAQGNVDENSLKSRSCSSDHATIDMNFPTANMGQCEVISDSHFRLHLLPEDHPINPSPWYSFRVAKSPGSQAQTVTITLYYDDFSHRYPPKVSTDRVTWTLLPTEAQEVVDDNEIRLTLSLENQPLYVAAQPLLDNQMHADWLAEQRDRWPGSNLLTLGFSHEQRPIHALVANPGGKRVILLLGRAHPPELPGAFAFQYFVEFLWSRRIQACAEQLPACQFFLDHQFILVPNLNPDGVAHGHWRHNMDSTDLNRDWGVFNQPETKVVNDLLLQQMKSARELVLMLDFHSTNRNVLYTQTTDDVTHPANFTDRWLRAREQIGTSPEIEHAPRPYDPELGTSKNYFFALAGSPSITFEVGDKTTLAESEQLAHQFAGALIRTLSDQAPLKFKLENRDYFRLMATANLASLLVLTQQGYIESEEANTIKTAQDEILQEIAQGSRPTSSNYLDLESALIEKVGSVASNAHLGRSRQDLHGITRRMLARDALLDVMQELNQSRVRLNQRSLAEVATQIPSFTHGVPAQPTTLGHQFQAFAQAFSRDFERLRESYSRLNQSQLGSMAGVGSSLPLARNRLAELLGFSQPVVNTFDANFLSTADYKLETIHALAQSASTISMFVENVHSQLRYPNPWIYLDIEGTSLSSSMPQKLNPRPLDRIRTKANEVIGDAQTQLLHTHNVDTGMHDYRSVNHLLETFDKAVQLYNQFANLIGLIRVNQDSARDIIEHSFVTSSGLVEHLVANHQLSVRQANIFTQALVREARIRDRKLQDLPPNFYQKTYRDLFSKAISRTTVRNFKRVLEIDHFLNTRTTAGGPSRTDVTQQIKAMDQQIAQDIEWLQIQRAGLLESEHRINQAFVEITSQD